MKILGNVICFGLGVALFKAGHALATAERGYQALGGEIFLLILPALIWGIHCERRENHGRGL